MRYICENCNQIIETDATIRLLLEDRDRDGDLVVGYFAFCACGQKLLIRKEKFLLPNKEG